MQPITRVLLDVDDTIFPTGEPWPFGLDSGLETLQRLIRDAQTGNSPGIGFVTGREIPYVLGFTRLLSQVPDCWSVVESGAFLFNTKTQEELTHPALTVQAQELFCKIREQRIPQLCDQFPHLKPYEGKRVNIALECRDPQIPMRECEKQVREALQDLLDQRLITMHASSIAVDISPYGVDKGTGVLFLAKEEGINPSQILVIGDSGGDFPAFEAVGHVGCPSNASDECKQLVQDRGGYVSTFPYVMGVVDIISHLVES